MKHPKRNDLLPEMELVQVAVKDLKMPKHQTRKLKAEHIAEVADQIAALGFSVPVLLGKNNAVLDGVSRVKAAEQLGLVQIPCVRLDHLTEDEQRVLRLASNKMTEKGEWDMEMLKLEFQELTLTEAPIELSGFLVRRDWGDHG